MMDYLKKDRRGLTFSWFFISVVIILNFGILKADETVVKSPEEIVPAELVVPSAVEVSETKTSSAEEAPTATSVDNKIIEDSTILDTTSTSASFDINNSPTSTPGTSTEDSKQTSAFDANPFDTNPFYITDLGNKASLTELSPEMADTVKTTLVVAGGLPVKWSKLVKISDLESGARLLSLPRKSKNIKITRITADQAKDILQALPQEELSLKQRIDIAEADQPKAFLFDGMISSIGKIANGLGNAAGNVVDFVVNLSNPDIVSTLDATVVDLSGQILTESLNSTLNETEGYVQIDYETPAPMITEELIDTGKIVTVSSSNTENARCESLQQNNKEGLLSVIPNTLSLIKSFFTTGLKQNMANILQIFSSQSEIPYATSTVSPTVSPDVLITDEKLVASDTAILENSNSTSTSTIETLPNSTEVSTTSIVDVSTSSTEISVQAETSLPAVEQAQVEQAQDVYDSCLQNQIHLTDVLASTKISEIYKVGEENKIKIKWKNNDNQNVSFHAYDTDDNGKLDYVEWTVPHLSDQTFEIIFISKALQLDENQNVIADIFDQVSVEDKSYATVPDGNYVRTTFEQPLDNTKDITIYAKLTDEQEPASIEVYPIYTDVDGNQTEGPKLALVDDGINPNFSNINKEGKYRILLSNLQTPTDQFDLKVSGGVDIDYIVDPAEYYWVGGTTNSNTNNPVNWSTVAGACADSANATAPGPGDTVHFVSSCTNNATINSALSVTNYYMDSGYSGTVTSNASLITSGDVTISAGTLNLNGFDMTIDGNYTNTGTITAGSGTTYFTKMSGTQTLNSGGVDSTKALNHLMHTGAGTLQLSTNSLQLNGNFINLAGTFNSNNLNLSIKGSYSNQGTFTAGSGTVTLNGTSVGNIINPGASSFNNLTVNGAGGSWGLSSGGLPDWASPNSAVYAIAAPDPTHVYVGGNFTNLAGVTGRNYIAMWNGSAWSTVGAAGDVNGTVYAIAAPDPTHVYVGGNFTNFAGVTGRNYIAMWNGSTWSTVGATGDVSAAVRAIAAPDLTHVYVGGDFINLAGVTGRNKIAMWNGSAWSTVGATGDVSSNVNAIAAPDLTHVYVGGDFTNLAGVTGRNKIAMWDGSAWSTVGAPGDVNFAVYAIAAPDTSHVYVGGLFMNLAGVTGRNRIAMWNGSAWSPVGAPGDFNNAVRAIAAPDATHVYVGGGFFNLAGVTGRNYIAMWNGSAWSTVGAVNDVYGEVYAIAAPDTSHVYVGGNLNLAGVTGRNYFAMWNGSAWSTVGAANNNVNSVNAIVYAIAAPDTSHVYVGGNFTNLAGVTGRNYIAMWNGSTWSTVGAASSVNGIVRAIAAPDTSHVYVGGDFSTLANVTGRNYIAMWNGSAWSTVGAAGNVNGAVNAIAAPDLTHVYIGGQFTNLAGVTGRNYIAMWNGSAWSTVGAVSNVSAAVNAIAAPDNTHVYVGGNFINLAGVTGRNKIAMWNGSAWSTVGATGDVSSSVNAIAAPDLTHVYIGGQFTNLAGVTGRNYIAMWNGSTWSTVGAASNVNNAVYAIAAPDNTHVYAGGDFTNLGVSGRNYIAMWNGSAWSTVGAASDVNNTVNAIAAPDNTHVYVGGNFTNLAGVTGRNKIAMWNGSSWQTITKVLLTILGNFNISAGTLNLSSALGEIDLAGNLSNSGTFDASALTVLLNGANQTISGSITFYNLIKSVTSSAILTFAANSTQTITHALTLNGAAGKLLNLVSSIPGTAWNLNTTGATVAADYLGVTDSNSTVSVIPTHSVNNGNNTNWDFVLSPGTINSCGTINQSGTYTLGGNITGVVGLCFKVQASGVIIDGSASHYSITAAGGNSSYAILATSTNANGGDGYGTTTIQNITFSGFGGGINASGNSGVGVAGGAGGNISISTSTLGTILASGGSSNSANGGSAGAISITDSTVTSVTGSGGNGASGANGSGTVATITNSSTGNVTSSGVNGSIVLSGTNLNLSNNTYTAGSTLSITNSGVLTTTNTILSALTHLIIQGTDYGVYAGGEFPLLPGEISSCGNLYLAGTYTLSGDTTSNCNVLTSGITIAGGTHTLNGDITANNYGVTLSGINVTGAVSTTGAGAGALTVNNSSNLNGTISVTGTISGDHSSSLRNTTINAGGTVSTSSVSFVGDVLNNGTINSGNAVVGKITNNATINGDFTFNASSTNVGTVNGNAIFNASSTNYSGVITGTVAGTARFNTITALDGVVAFSGVTTFGGLGTVMGNISDSSGSPITSWMFNGSSTNTGIIKGDAIFNDTSGNTTSGIVQGNAIFNNTSTNLGIVTGNSTINSPVVRPLGGTTNGQSNYYGYPGLYFNDTAAGHGATGKWNDRFNWWLDASFTQNSPVIASAGDNVTIYGDITSGGPATVKSAIFQMTSSNGIYLTVASTSTDAALFNGSSTNAVGGTINGNATFTGGTDNLGTVTGHITRLYSTGIYVITGDLIHNGTVYLVQVLSGAQVFLANATNYIGVIFQALNNGLFDWGLNAHINPDLIINSMVIESNAKWSPNISWGTSYLVQYKTDEIGGGVYMSASSTLNGRDIPRPSAGYHTYFFKSTDAQGDVTEKSVSFTYDNSLAVSTDCSSPLDEVTRPYYYLSTNVAGNCTATASTTLRGNDGNGNYYIISGNLTGSNSNIVLQNLSVTGNTSNFASMNVSSSTLSGAVDVLGSLRSDTLSSFGNTTIEPSGTVYSGTFTGNVVNSGIIVSGTTTPVNVLGNTTNNGVINGDFVFNATSTNHGTVNGNAILNGGSINNGTITGNVTVNSNSLNLGNVGEDLIFNTLTAVDGKIAFSSSTRFFGTGHVSGAVKDNSGASITKWMFNDSSTNVGYTKGDAYFNNTSTNAGTIEGNAYVYASVTIPLTGVVTGTIAYHSYPNAITFKDSADDGLWSNTSNWFTDTTLTTHANRLPNSNEDVVLLATTTLPANVINNVYVATSGITVYGGDYTLTGSISGNGAYGGYDAFNFDLGNITVTGTTSAIGGDGVPGVSNGGRGGIINIATSSTGEVVVNGGDPLQNGGNAGTSTIVNSFAIVDGTRILAVGGASSGCGFGGNGGNIFLIESSGYVLITDKGVDATSTCVVIPPTPAGRSGGSVNQIGIYVSPATRAALAAAAAAVNNRNPMPSSGSMDPFFAGLANKNIGKLNLANLPFVGLGNFGSENLGTSKLVNPLAGLLQLQPVGGFNPLPKINLQAKIKNFQNSSLPQSLVNLGNFIPFIKKELTSAGIKNGYDLYSMKESPINTPTLTELAKDKTKQPTNLLFVSIDGRELSTKLSIDSKGKVYQIITVEPDIKISINVKSIDKSLPKTFFDNNPVLPTKDKNNNIKILLNTPTEVGTRVLTVRDLTLEIRVVKPEAPVQPKVEKNLSPIKKTWSWFK